MEVMCLELRKKRDWGAARGTIKKKQERGAFIPCTEQESMYNSKNL